MVDFARLSFLILAAIFALASSSSTSNNPPPAAPATYQPQAAPASQSMDPRNTLGLWKSNFGPVKIVEDRNQGAQGLMGVWVYDREGQEVIGFFSGIADGNVLNFRWQEPSAGAPLEGAGYLVFDPSGNSFTGRWWTDNRDRGGDWNGWREQSGAPAPAPNPATYGSQPTSPPPDAPPPRTYY